MEMIKNREEMYHYMLTKANEGSHVMVDFASRFLRIEGYNWVHFGTEMYGKTYNEKKKTIPEILNRMEELFEFYYTSVPSEMAKESIYFQGKTYEELTDRELACNVDRNLAKAAIEGYMLLHILSGELTWDKEYFGYRFFWQSKKHPELIILRDWVEGK